MTKGFLAIQTSFSLRNVLVIREGEWYNLDVVERRNDGQKLRKALNFLRGSCYDVLSGVPAK